MLQIALGANANYMRFFTPFVLKVIMLEQVSHAH